MRAGSRYNPPRFQHRNGRQDVWPAPKTEGHMLRFRSRAILVSKSLGNWNSTQLYGKYRSNRAAWFCVGHLGNLGLIQVARVAGWRWAHLRGKSRMTGLRSGHLAQTGEVAGHQASRTLLRQRGRIGDSACDSGTCEAHSLTWRVPVKRWEQGQ